MNKNNSKLVLHNSFARVLENIQFLSEIVLELSHEIHKVLLAKKATS
jgi:hypothetical protein